MHLITSLSKQRPFPFALPELDQPPHWLVVAHRLKNQPHSDTVLSMAANTIRDVQVLNVRPLYTGGFRSEDVRFSARYMRARIYDRIV